MEVEEVAVKENLEGSPEGDKHSEPMSPDKIKEFEDELIRLGEDASANIQRLEEEFPENPEEVDEEVGYPHDAEKIIEKGEIAENEENDVEVEAEEFPEKPSEEVNVLKKYQSELQELKEEISRLNKQLDHKSRQSGSQPSERDLFKLQSLCRMAKAEAKTLQAKAEELAMLNSQTEESLENLKAEASNTVSSDKVLSLQQKLRELEKEYQDLNKSYDVSIADLDKITSPDAPQKLVNEFNVNLQKRIGFLDIENTKLTGVVKKSSLELAKLKEKLDNAESRHKQNEELKSKLRGLEEALAKYDSTEVKLLDNLKQAKEEYSIYSSRPENQHDAESARNILKDMRDQVYKEETEVENLEFVLQEKKNLLRAAQVYGLQRSKTSNKLRTDMELLGLVLVEKEQIASRLRKEIEEFRIRTNQTQIDIKEIQDRKNKAY